jgi:hypothetical protein
MSFLIRISSILITRKLIFSPSPANVFFHHAFIVCICAYYCET